MNLNLDSLNQNLARIIGTFIDERDRLRKSHSDWPMYDARVTIFNKCGNITQTVYLAVVFMQRHLTKSDWWEEMETYGATKEDIQLTIHRFNQFLRTFFIQELFSLIEGSFRVFVRALDPNACNQGRDAFKNIYVWLLSRLSISSEIPLLDLMRNIRNTMHNDGVFLPTNDKDVVVEWKGKEYHFVVGKVIDFISWSFLLNLMPDISSLIGKTVESNELAHLQQISSQLQDS